MLSSTLWPAQLSHHSCSRRFIRSAAQAAPCMQVVHSAAASSSRCSKRTSRERLPSKPAAVGDSSSGQPSGPDPPQAARGADQPADADVAARVAALAAAAVKAQAESAAAARVAAAPLQTPSTAPAAAPPTTPSPTDTTLATAQAAGSAEAAVSNVGTNGNRNNSSSIAQEAPDASLPPTTGNGGPPPDDLPPIEELVIAAAQEEMKDELRVLHDAALGRFSESESSGSGDGQVPLLQRLAHFASGAFLKNSWPEVSSSPSSASSATKERDAAAAGLKTAAAAADDDDSATAAPGALTVPEVVEAVVLEPSSAEHTTDQQQQQPGKATSSSQGSMDDTSGEIEAVDEDEYEDGVGPAAAPMAWVPVTSVVALAMAAVAVAQWWPVLPDVWWGLNNGYARDVLWQMATTFPDTPVTQALQLDVAAIANRSEWHRLLSSGLLHSGVLPVLWCVDGLRNAGSWIEAWCGGLQALIIILASGVGTGLAQLLAGSASVGLGGAGVVTGAYAAWCVLGLTRARGEMPLTSDRGIIYMLLNACLAAYQPAVGAACLLGGATGGVLGVLLAPLLARVVFLAVALPVTFVLAAARLVVETVRLLFGIMAAFVVATWRAVAEVVRTVRGL